MGPALRPLHHDRFGSGTAGKKRYTIHLLPYIPVRKSAVIDLIEERTPLRDVALKTALPKAIRKIRLVPENRELSPGADGNVTVLVDGYAILELSYD